MHANMNADPTAPTLPSFAEFFQALWPYEPFPWQAMLAERVVTGEWPQALDLPTAAGKTACIDVGIYSLAAQAGRTPEQRTAPRRIWFVVDRRIVVDEAYDRALRIADKLSAATDGPLKAIAERLRHLSGTERPLATARLRGGVLRDDNYARLPSQPAIITSTVDQLGSRLLFRSYCGSQRVAPIHAGLAGNDSLILLDEAHCSVPFLQTLQHVKTYRGKDWAEQPIALPFAFSVLSATPPPDIPPESVFPGAIRKAALAHPILQDRLNATKPAELISVKASRKGNADSLVGEAVERARSWISRHGRCRVAIIVNRVRTAEQVARLLRTEIKPDEADVVLLTGRLRPLERDQLTGQWKRFLKAANPEPPPKPILFVSTQCIEVGADFSFDALLTECASLDALRQRFGRLNRMGLPGEAPAIILVREDDLDDKIVDPIYGDALRLTWALLIEKAEIDGDGKSSRRVIDFGFTALDATLSDMDDERRDACLAPRPDAPVLLPAHVDLLCQTAPTPHPEPDISLFLHGKDRGVPEVRVLWRADLAPARTDLWVETIGMCPPLSTESVSVPLYRLRSLLAESVVEDEAGDMEGAARTTEDDAADRIRPCLPWRGRDRSKVVRITNAISPGDVVILPSDYGLAGLAQSLADDEEKRGLGAAKSDLWEWALESAGKPFAFRINRRLLQPWVNCPPVKELLACAEASDREKDQLWELIGEVIRYEPADGNAPPAPPRWLSGLLAALPRDARIDEHPAGGLILSARVSKRRASEPDLFADDDDLASVSGEAVPLETHTASVVRAIQKLAGRCLPDEFLKPMELAAQWHDIGKFDERFQIILHNGDEVDAAAGVPLAKSADLPLSPNRRRLIREASHLPNEFRHEMLSTQLAERVAPLCSDATFTALVLHLIASHHGHARPFAPVSQDPEPPSIEGTVGTLAIKLAARDRAGLIPAHQIDSGIAERFWGSTRRYGWWGLAYLEAVLRLADWYGSEFALAKNKTAEDTP